MAFNGGKVACRRPTLAAVGRDFDLGDLAVARPGKPCDLVDARFLHCESRRWTRDHRLAFLRKNELEGFAVRHRDRVLRRLVLGHGGAFGELDAPKPFHIHVAFKSRKQQPHGIAIRRPHALGWLSDQPRCAGWMLQEIDSPTPGMVRDSRRPNG
jgi:hypothetical protein